MKYEENKIKKSIIGSLEGLDLQADVIADVTFHMTDWLEDVSDWNSFCEAPDSLSEDELQDLLLRFLVHVPAHVAAASKLITGLPVEDVFGVGATSERKN